MYAKMTAQQRNFFQEGKTRSLAFREEQLTRLKKMIEDNEARILAALKADLGKSHEEGYLTEVGFVLNELNYMLKNLVRFARPKKVPTPLAYFSSRSRVMPEPYGVVLIISPWNYPFQLTLAPLVGAIAAGNCTMIKPSEHSTHTTALLKELMAKTFDPGYIKVVTGEIPETQALLKQKFDYIFFTGSGPVGKIVMQAAAQHLTPITLELGGKSPCIIEPDVDLKLTARRVAWGKFLNAGQTCVAPDYILINKEIKADFLKELRLALEQFYGNDPHTSEHFGRIINDRHFQRLTGLLADGTVVCGGETKRDALYIAPTILTNVDTNSALMEEEIFGPLLPVLSYERLEEAVDFVNTKPKPLALYFFSRSAAKVDYVLTHTSSGGVCINDTISHMTSKWLPFGGVGPSGMGNYHGRASFAAFSHNKSVLKTGFRFDLKPKYPPYRTSLRTLRKLLRFL